MMWILYLIFLIGFSAMKYNAVPQAAAAFDAGYIRSTAIVTAMTGVAPFFLAWLGTRPLSGQGFLVSALMGLILTTALCIGGYAMFWYFFIPPDPAFRPPLWGVAIRGYLPGIVMGCILAYGFWSKDRRKQ